MTVTPSGIEELTAADQAEINESIATQMKRLADLLPSQGPITAFAFLNPLQGASPHAVHRCFAAGERYLWQRTLFARE